MPPSKVNSKTGHGNQNQNQDDFYNSSCCAPSPTLGWKFPWNIFESKTSVVFLGFAQWSFLHPKTNLTMHLQWIHFNQEFLTFFSVQFRTFDITVQTLNLLTFRCCFKVVHFPFNRAGSKSEQTKGEEGSNKGEEGSNQSDLNYWDDLFLN